jgi:hypothetical protein
VWPVQKFNWRDLARGAASWSGAKGGAGAPLHPVGRMRDGLEKVEVVPESHFDRKTKQEVRTPTKAIHFHSAI